MRESEIEGEKGSKKVKRKKKKRGRKREGEREQEGAKERLRARKSERERRMHYKRASEGIEPLLEQKVDPSTRRTDRVWDGLKQGNSTKRRRNLGCLRKEKLLNN